MRLGRYFIRGVGLALPRLEFLYAKGFGIAVAFHNCAWLITGVLCVNEFIVVFLYYLLSFPPNIPQL